ncbi:MAG TPA: hypothetical protein VGC13_24770 [Longimicrobium sp.]|jgi:hypothetical protein|uniref:hypothetical protein n=1 Tax=Longimicrobium sp. TaxID=2029185 RepID=UPI002ED7CEFC
MRRAGGRTGFLCALVLLATAARCTPAASAPGPGAGAAAGALSALVELMAARAGADSVAVAPAPGYSRDRVPLAVWGLIASLPGLDPTTLTDFERRNAAPAPFPRLASASVVIRQDASTPGTLALRLSPAGISASGAQALVVAETVCGAGCMQGEAFLLRREGGAWHVATSATLFIS